MGRIRRGRSGAQVSRHGAWFGFGLGLLLPNYASGRHSFVHAGSPRRGRYPGPHAVADYKQVDVAAHDDEDLWTQIGTSQVWEVPKGDGASSFPNPRLGRGVN